MRFSGEIGFAQSVEGTGNHIGIWEDVIKERHYYGDVLQNYHRWEQGIDINENLNLSNKISIFADRFCLDNYFKMRYVVLNGWRCLEWTEGLNYMKRFVNTLEKLKSGYGILLILQSKTYQMQLLWKRESMYTFSHQKHYYYSILVLCIE